MRYYLDTEFDGAGGPLLSIALVRNDGEYIYCVMDTGGYVNDPWVKENVVPHLMAADNITLCKHRTDASRTIEEFLIGDQYPHVVADWPIDFVYLSLLLVPDPTMMIDIPGIVMEVIRVEAYPTELTEAVQHNAYWDAMALRRKLEGAQTAATGAELLD